MKQNSTLKTDSVREAEIERQLVSYVKSIGGRAFKFVSPGNIGVPDRIVVLPGGVIWFVELKTSTGRLSPPQERQIAKLTELNANVFVLKGTDGLKAFKTLIGREVVTP